MPIKWQKEDGSPRKNLYHSYLVREGRTMVKWKGDVRESKYPKGSATHYVYFNVPDDVTDYCLAVEPECIERIQDAPKGVWLYVQATGGRDEPPGIIMEDGAGPVFHDMDAETYQAPDDAPQDEPAISEPVTGQPVVDIAGGCVMKSLELAELFAQGGHPMTASEIQGIWSTLYIQAARR